jgi:hypothetical protein
MMLQVQVTTVNDVTVQVTLVNDATGTGNHSAFGFLPPNDFPIL